MSETTDPSLPTPEPRWNRASGPGWGPTPQPVQQPAAEPGGARTGALLILGAVVIIAVVLLVHALTAS
ncbi:hypothetical protein [Actinacidiphila sp. ITFR-21]|uniref:hypothetical protein n=1 Tax=Actinacidiphila sp. ITFR-21 TaxID=3075199 RepID=UPI00288B3598|nr:hypothetical protein [Streptomyces sp. ITFR-21]WNI14445.1 hypothetical protein RLT57_02075 [Streptomyces sp. ITFR-21]